MCGKTTPLFMLAVSLLILLTSCNQNRSESSNHGSFDNYLKDSATDTKTASQKDNSKKISINLPVKLDSSSYLVYPIHELTTAQKKSFIRSYESGDWREGYLTNLIFQNIHTEKTHVLTKNTIKIEAYEQLYSSKREAEKIILYQVIDNFPKDKDSLTFKSLYLSTTDGKLFQKISTDNEHLTGWKYISETKKVYFKTIEDSDNNIKFNNADKEHIYSVSIQNFKVTEILKDAL